MENLTAALAEYTKSDQEQRPLGRQVDEAIELARALVGQIDALVSGYDWRAKVGGPKGWLKAALGLLAWLRSPQTPGNQGGAGEVSLAGRYRDLTSKLGRAWALAAGAENLADIAERVRFYEEVRIWMAKYDAAERVARAESPIVV